VNVQSGHPSSEGSATLRAVTLFVNPVSTLSPIESLQYRLESLLAQAWQALNQSPESSSGLAREAEHLARRLGDNHNWAHSLLIWGASALYAGQAQEAITLLSRALAVYRFTGDEQGQWSCLMAIARAWTHLGEVEQAHETQAVAHGFPQHEDFSAQAAWLRWFGGV